MFICTYIGPLLWDFKELHHLYNDMLNIDFYSDNQGIAQFVTNCHWVKSYSEAGGGTRATLASNASYTMPNVKLSPSRCQRQVSTFHNI